MKSGEQIQAILLAPMVVFFALELMGIAAGNPTVQTVAASGALLCLGLGFGWRLADRKAKAAADAATAEEAGGERHRSFTSARRDR